MNRLHVESGLDRIDTVNSLLKGRRIGLMTNPTGITHDLTSGIDLIHARYDLRALLSCEHGIRGDAQAGAEVATYVDPETGVTVYSTYSAKNQRLDEEMLAAFDVLVFDMQDVGARFYTYLYSLSYAMESCAKAGKTFIVLDRINPISGVKRCGTLLDRRFSSFVGDYELPTQYGLTIGEYARYVKAYLHLDLDLHVVGLSGWKRELYLDDTDLPWVAPSPNCATLQAALCYIGTCVFEGTNLSEGRGTTLPFEMIGAPWVNGVELEKRMNALALPGVHFRRTAFTPTFSKHAGELCIGVQVHITQRDTFNAFNSGLLLLDTIRSLHPDKFEFVSWNPNEPPALCRLMGTDEYTKGTLSAQEIIDKYAPKVAAFGEHTIEYQLYS
ncbi:MAG: DUF1343 domain-containing protein [Clostridia bacterium]